MNVTKKSPGKSIGENACTAGIEGVIPGAGKVSKETGSVRRRIAASLGVSALMLLFGCSNTYTPVINTIGVVGPAGQPSKYAAVISNTSTPANPNSLGLVTLIDFAGDNVVVTSRIGVNPRYFILDNTSTPSATSTTGYTINGDFTLNSFPLTVGSGNAASLEPQNVNQTTLLSNALPLSISPEGANTYVAEPGRSAVAQLSAGGGTALQFVQEYSNIPNPVYIVGNNNSPRAYTLSQGATPGTSAGQAIAIEAATNTLSGSILPIGNLPVYGIMTADNRRAFVMNKASNTVSVINAQTNSLDAGLPAPTFTNSQIPVGVGPVWADFAPVRTEMVVANQGDGVTPGSLSVVSIPLCSPAATPTNVLCDPNNPIDAVGFGTVLATLPVGVNPVMVSVLSDGSRAYVANAGVLPSGGNPGVPGSVSVVNLSTNTVTATIPVNGHPNYIATSNGSPTGKVYVTSGDSRLLTIIATDTDTVDTSIDLQGLGVSVRVTVQ